VISGILFAGVGVAVVGSLFLVRGLLALFVDPPPRSRGGSRLAREIREAASYPPIDASGPRLLLLRGVDDEASLTLAAGSIGSRLSSVVAGMLRGIVRAIDRGPHDELSGG
jgi:hypothetical protein